MMICFGLDVVGLDVVGVDVVGVDVTEWTLGSLRSCEMRSGSSQNAKGAAKCRHKMKEAQ